MWTFSFGLDVILRTSEGLMDKKEELKRVESSGFKALNWMVHVIIATLGLARLTPDNIPGLRPYFFGPCMRRCSSRLIRVDAQMSSAVARTLSDRDGGVWSRITERFMKTET